MQMSNTLNLSQSHYDKPQSHSTTQTRWVVPGSKQIYAPSLKLLDLVITPNHPAYYASLVGAYGCIKRVQIKMNSKEVDVWYAQSVLPYLLAQTGDNEKQICVNSVLFGSGNNVIYEPDSQQLQLFRPPVGPSTSLKLSVFSNLFDSIGVINSDMEIIIDWETNFTKYICPVNVGQVTSVSIAAPYLSYETLNGNFPQPAKVAYTQWVEDVFAVPAIAETNKDQQIEIRSNAFNNKTIGRLMLTNTPASIANTSPANRTVSNDLAVLYNLFGYYQSTPMRLESFNIAKEGKNILTFRNVSNDAIKLSVAHDSWGPSNFVSGGHYHSVAPILRELNNQLLNGFCSYGCVEINDLIRKELQITYRRTSAENDTPALADTLLISCVAEVKCALINGEKVYL